MYLYVDYVVKWVHVCWPRVCCYFLLYTCTCMWWNGSCVCVCVCGDGKVCTQKLSNDQVDIIMSEHCTCITYMYAILLVTHVHVCSASLLPSINMFTYMDSLVTRRSVCPHTSGAGGFRDPNQGIWGVETERTRENEGTCMYIYFAHYVYAYVYVYNMYLSITIIIYMYAWLVLYDLFPYVLFLYVHVSSFSMACFPVSV